MKTYGKLIVVISITIIMLANMGAINAKENFFSESTRSHEIIELRNNNSKTYQLSDGSKEWVGYAEDIHYLDENGEYREISNDIIADSYKHDKVNYKYKNEANAFVVRFADLLDNNRPLMTIKCQDKAISLAPIGANTSPAIELINTSSARPKLIDNIEGSMVYKDIYPGIDLIYEVKSFGVKEYIVINQPTKQSQFTFDMKLDGLKAKQDEGTITFLNSEDKAIFHIGELFAVDDSGTITRDVNCVVSGNDNQYQIKLIVNEDYLFDSNRTYPIVIDPSIMVTGASATADSYVSSRYPNTNYYLNNYLRTGRDEDYYVRRTLIKFNLPSWIPSDQVTNAYIRLEKHSGATPNIIAYRATSSWGSSTVTWNNKPSYTSTNASPKAYNDSGNWWRMTTTNIVKSWLNSTSNYGFVIRDATESGTTQWTTFYSSDAPSPHKPELHIIYKDNRFLSYAWPNSTVYMKPYTFSAPWQDAITKSRNAWGNSSSKTYFLLNTSSGNEIKIVNEDYKSYGYMRPQVTGSTITRFTIELNSRSITQTATNLPNFIQSVMVHELGHTTWLDDNPVTPEASIMKYTRNRNSMINPQTYDITGVNSKY